MRRVVFAFLAALVLVSLAHPAAAADAPENPLETTTPEANQTTHEQIDSATRLVSSSYDASEGTATVVIESDIPQKIVLTDAGGFVQGGVVEQRSAVATPGERVKITMPVTKADGFVGVSITTQKTLYAVPLKSHVEWFSGDSTWQTVQIAALGGASGVLVMAGFVAYRLRNGGKERTERVA